MQKPARRRRRIFWLTLGTLLVFNVVVALARSNEWLPPDAGMYVESGRDWNLGQVASDLVGVRAEVWCWSRADWRERTDKLTRDYQALGHSGRSPYGPWSAFAVPSRGEIHLSPEVCSEVRRLAEERVLVSQAEWPDALAWSVMAFGHEAYHVFGVAEEAAAECYSLQSIDQTARLLGRSEADARDLTRRYIDRWRGGLPASYRSRECRSGGALDLEPDQAAWP